MIINPKMILKITEPLNIFGEIPVPIQKQSPFPVSDNLEAFCSMTFSVIILRCSRSKRILL